MVARTQSIAPSEPPKPMRVGHIEFTLEKFDDFLEEARPLWQLHWEEIAVDRDILRLNVDLDYYRRAQHTMLFVNVRCGGALIGYVWWQTYQHPHYKHVSCADNDIHFLLPGYRRGLNGYMMLKTAISVIKDAGVQYCFFRERVGHLHPALMQRLGFAPLDMTYSCDLTKEGAA